MAGKLTIHSSTYGADGDSLAGHSWIEYQPDGGQPTTYGTWGNNPGGRGNGLLTNLERDRGLVGEAHRSVHINDEQERRLFSKIDEYRHKGQNGWEYLNPCSGFAADAWEAATGEKLQTRSNVIISNPSKLKESIAEAERSHVQPGTVQPGTVQPGTVQPGTVQPGAARDGASSSSAKREPQAATGNTAKTLADDRREIVDQAKAQLPHGRGFLRDAGIREIPVGSSGVTQGEVLTKTDQHVAIKTGPNAFAVLQRDALNRDVQVGEQVAVRMSAGRGTVQTPSLSRSR